MTMEDIPQIRQRPNDLGEVASQLCFRHTLANRLQVHRLDTAFRTFSAAAACEDPQAQDATLRSSIRAYFGQQAGDAGAFGAAEEMEGLPLRAADPMLGADCRALLLQLQEASSKVTRSGSSAQPSFVGSNTPSNGYEY